MINSSEEYQSISALKSEDNQGKIIDRGKPVLSAIVVTYKPLKHLALLARGGMEFSMHKDFSVVRIDVEAPFHVPNY